MGEHQKTDPCMAASQMNGTFGSADQAEAEKNPRKQGNSQIRVRKAEKGGQTKKQRIQIHRPQIERIPGKILI